jgi:hypothetical protein
VKGVARFAVVLALLAGGAGRSGASARRAAQRAAPPRPPASADLRVLFIGNSLTYANDLPLMVQALARAAGLDLYVESVTAGGAGLDDHWRGGEAQRAISRRGWNVVVLQQGPSSLPESRVHLRKWARQFAAPIRQAGARPALYMVWPDKTRLAWFDAVRDSYTLAAADVDGILLPAGEAWRAAWRRDPRARLYGMDGLHPSVAGSYAAALSIYGMLCDRPPRDLPARLALANGQTVDLPRPLATLLQEAATEANQKYGRR